MDFYQEITLIEQMDVDYNHIHSATIQSLHGAIAAAKKNKEIGSIALSFPEYYYNAKSKKGFLGCKIRCFAANKHSLAKLDLKTVLDSISDYVHVSSEKEVGDKATHYEIYTKYRHKSAVKKAERLQAHLIEKLGKEKFDKEFDDFDAVIAHCERNNQQLAYPYVNLTSTSSGNPYHIAIKREVVDIATENSVFSGYGLSDQSMLSAVPAW